MLPRAIPNYSPPLRKLEDEPEAVTAYRRALPKGEVFAYPLDPLDHLGVPTWSAELFASRGTSHHGVGYGETDGRAAIGAFGELSETLFAGDAIGRTHKRRATFKELLAELGPDGVLDPLTVCLPAGSDYAPTRPLRWVEARRWATGGPVLVPLEFAAASPLDAEPEGGWLLTPITNGLGAGPTREHAMAHGILELVQRDGNSATYRALDRGVRIDLDGVQDRETRDLLDKLDGAGVEVIAKLAATDFGLTNLYVVGAERDLEKVPHPLMLTACGEAADPDPQSALRKALLEFCAGRSRKLFDNGPLAAVAAVAPGFYTGHAIRAATREHEEEPFLKEAVRWLRLDARGMYDLIRDPVLSVRSGVPFSALPVPGEAEEQKSKADLLADRLAAEGFDVLHVDFSTPEAEAAGVRVVKAIVPGLEVETASYGRIGARNLRRLLERDDGLVGTGEPPKDRPQARPILLPDAEREEFGGAAWFDYGALEKTVSRLRPLYREPSRHVAALVADGVL